MSKFFKKSFGFISVTFLLLQLQLSAQDNNPISKISISSPTAASLGKFGDIPINYHTGIPQINIPIYTVSAGPLSLPISLSYHASGLKVQEPASWVGAGWALNAGGVITRSVMGAPDEKGTNNGGMQTHGHFSDYGYNNYIWNAGMGSPIFQGGEDWAAVSKGWLDGEPDLFFFNFGGYSGKFYFRDDRTPVVVPEADFKIEPYYNPQGIIKSIQSFVITTPDGVKYYFGQTPGLTGTAPIEITNPSTPGNGLSSAQVYSSWYLHKITTADELFSINLTYETEDYGFHTISMFPMEGSEPPGGYPTFGAAHGYDLIKNMVHGVRLSQITFPNGTVNFSTDGMAARSDLSDTNPYYIADAVNQNAKPLGSIIITDGMAMARKFNFSYGYFEDNITPIAQDITNFAPNLFTDKKRLRLDQIQEISGDNSLSKPPYNFTYFSEQVPRRLSFGIDHWGYSNGITNNTGLIPSYIETTFSHTTYHSGADRDSYWPAMRAGTLQQINYPTGGYSFFEFEPNTVYNTNTSYVNVPLSNLVVHLYGQNTYTNSSVFTSNGTFMNLSINNGTNYPAIFTITDNSNTVIHSQSVPEYQNFTFTVPMYPQGTYTARLSINTSSTGGAQSSLTQWQSVTTTNNVIIGGNRIKKITHNDGVTGNDMISNYDYNGDNNHSSAILYSRPAYVGIIRNNFVRDVGLFDQYYGFMPTYGIYGCPYSNLDGVTYFKSTCSIRPMATTQGNPLGYSQVKVSQSGNGFSVYKYYGPTGVPPWQVNNGDVAVRAVNRQNCDNNAPSFPYAPLPYDFLRGELKYEAHYNENNQLLQEKSYTPVYVDNPIKTPGLIAASTGGTILATKYELTTARKTQTQVIETDYDPTTNTSLTATNTSYYESPFHTEVTRISAVNSKNELAETKKKYAFDFRLSTCESISDGYGQYNTDCATCLSNKNSAVAACPTNDNVCKSNAYLTYMHCLNTARANWVTYRQANFTNPTNNFKTNHDNAKAGADAELKPILQLQDYYQNSPVETTKWKNGNLLGATFSRFDYSANPAGKVYINKVQAINLNVGSSSFTNAITNTTNNGIVKDNRYQDESFVKFHDGNLAELTSKDGVTTAYLWGYNNNTLPIAKSIGVSHSTLLSAYNAVGGTLANLSQLRSQSSLSGAQLNTYVYTPITGMTSETDVNGKSMNYEYDALQRLLLVRDLNNNIVKQYDYKYQVLPPSGTPQWIATGATRCKPCPQNNNYISNILQQEEKDNNPLSGSYNTLRWADIGTNDACVVNADWQNTATAIRCRVSHLTNQNTGEQEQQQMDMNPCSSTYGQIRWIVVGVNYSICPLPAGCNSGNCTGDDKKCINNDCETGTKVYTGYFFDKENGQWMCIYHYHWSDNSDSINYYEISTGQCTISTDF